MASGGTDYGRLLKETWNAAIKTDNLIVLLVGALVVLIASPVALLAGPVFIGYALVCIRIGRGEGVEVRDLFSGFERFVPALITSLILGVGVIVGTVLCFIPGIVVAFLGSFTFHAMVDDENLSGMDAIKRSAELVKANLTDVVVVWLVGLVINAVLGATLVGVIAGVAFTAMMSGLLYDQMVERGGTDATGTTL